MILGKVTLYDLISDFALLCNIIYICTRTVYIKRRAEKVYLFVPVIESPGYLTQDSLGVVSLQATFAHCAAGFALDIMRTPRYRS